MSRRRMSMTGTLNREELALLDGVTTEPGKTSFEAGSTGDVVSSPTTKAPFQSYYSLSKVGYVPFNPSKANQDRACEVAPFGRAKDKAFFAVFDGHGQHGHYVSQFVASNLPKAVLRQKDMDSTDPAVVIRAFATTFTATNEALCSPSSGIDTAYSGSTGVAVYINRDTIYCANTGDSRCVLGTEVTYTDAEREQRGITIAPNSKLSAVPLSYDHKPESAQEMQRILQCGGRIEPCRTHTGALIGPSRVWLRDQDVPGLAMTRSFGDQVAASVGVSAIPEVVTRVINSRDRFVILASDGIWEFITSEEAVDIVAHCATPEQACHELVALADSRWRLEEDVVDDITVLIIFLK